MISDLFEAAGYSALFLGIGLGVLVLGWYVLDVITPGHKLGDRIKGDTGISTPASMSAAVVAGTWMLVQGVVIWRALWTNAVGTDLSDAIAWSIFFSLVALAFQTVAFYVLDFLTPGKLADEVCAPGPVTPLAVVAAANIVAVGLIVTAVIS